MATTKIRPARTTNRWRTVDIVVASVIAVAFGVVFWAWGQLWNVLEAPFAAFPPGRALVYGMWLVPGVLGALVIRKPGAALYTELIASIVSALLGSSWGLSVVVYGFFEGLAPELVFLGLLYRSYRWPVALVAAAAAGATAAVLDLWVYDYYAGFFTAAWNSWYLVIVVASTIVIAGFGSWLLTRALATTGVLAPFASGREQRAV